MPLKILGLLCAAMQILCASTRLSIQGNSTIVQLKKSDLLCDKKKVEGVQHA